MGVGTSAPRAEVPTCAVSSALAVATVRLPENRRTFAALTNLCGALRLRAELCDAKRTLCDGENGDEKNM
jgi:hypothetical protein